jgi:hypothetical protein
MTNWVRIFEALLPAPTEHLRSLYDYHGDLESAREALHQIREARLRRELPASGEVRPGRRRRESAS